MRAFEIGEGFGFANLKMVEKADPEPGYGKALVKIRAVSLNYRDLLVVTGAYSRSLRLPLVICSDGAGEVLQTGEGVTRVKRGDRVAAIFMQGWIAGELSDEANRSALGGAIQGVLAEKVVLHQDGLVHLPQYLSYEEGATLPCAAVTAWHALVAAGKVKTGDTVLVLGTGGVSIFALQFAKLAGARVVLTSSSNEKLERARQLGASELINYKANPEWEQRVRELTGGNGVDHVIEVGGAGTLPRSIKSVRLGGRISLIGVLTGTGDVNPLPLVMKNICLQGIYVGSREMFEAMNRAIALHQMRPVIDRVFGFDETPEALRYMQSGAHFGKIVVRVTNEK